VYKMTNKVVELEQPNGFLLFNDGESRREE
jgi:hypothetical protein